MLIILQNIFIKKIKTLNYTQHLSTIYLLLYFPLELLALGLWYVISDWSYYSSNWISILKMWEGGLAIQGGVMGGIIAGILYYKFKKVKYPLEKLFDLILPNILIAQAIGRWGNFFNKEVYGACVNRNSLSFIPNFILNNMDVCGSSLVAQPLFLYESILNTIGFVFDKSCFKTILNKKEKTETWLPFILFGMV